MGYIQSLTEALFNPLSFIWGAGTEHNLSAVLPDDGVRHQRYESYDC